jgi:hypothetical protein
MTLFFKKVSRETMPISICFYSKKFPRGAFSAGGVFPPEAYFAQERLFQRGLFRLEPDMS